MKKRHTPEQIVRKLREADALLSGGASVAEQAVDIRILKDVAEGLRASQSRVEL